MTAISDPALLQNQADLIRASGVLGRSSQLSRLFDYLLQASLAGTAVKEATIAIEAFGRDGGFDVAQDALVRVYIHKLRRKLDEYYVGEGRSQPVRLLVPKGNYSLQLEQMPDEMAMSDMSGQARVFDKPSRLPGWAQRFGLPGLLAMVLLAAALGFGAAYYQQSAQDAMRPVRHHPVWANVLNNHRPINIVVGDFYIFGDTEDSIEIRRMVREFHINSRWELDQHLMSHPELAARYVDMDLQYLPTSIAFAMRDVMLVLAPARERIKVVQMSDLSPEVLRAENVVFVGLLSSLGMLRDTVFERSNYAVGTTYDELVDTRSGTPYISNEGMRGQLHSAGQADAAFRYRDFGYLSSFQGANGNQFVTLAGTRDVGLMQLSSMAIQPEALEAISKQVPTHTPTAVEALYQVTGINRTNLDGKLIIASTLKPPKNP